jgi:hypothetical protein
MGIESEAGAEEEPAEEGEEPPAEEGEEPPAEEEEEDEGEEPEDAMASNALNVAGLKQSWNQA